VNIPLNVDPHGFIWYDGVKLPCRYLPERGALEFFDKDRRRGLERGSRVVEIPLSQFTDTLSGLVIAGVVKTVYNQNELVKTRE